MWGNIWEAQALTVCILSPAFEDLSIPQTDASNQGAGAILSQQYETGSDHPVAYFSCKIIIGKECSVIN